MCFHSRTPSILLGLIICVSCNTSKKSATVQQDRYVELESQIGNKLTVPSRWSTEEDGTAWYVRSPDNQAVINVFTYTAEGSGSPEDLGNLVAKWTLPAGETGWQESAWYPISLNQGIAKTRQLIPASGKSDFLWRIYVVHAGRMYHAIVLNASDVAMQMNGDFYESIVKTFCGIE
jgi:hypothetical protein